MARVLSFISNVMGEEEKRMTRALEDKSLGNFGCSVGRGLGGATDAEHNPSNCARVNYVEGEETKQLDICASRIGHSSNIDEWDKMCSVRIFFVISGG